MELPAVAYWWCWKADILLVFWIWEFWEFYTCIYQARFCCVCCRKCLLMAACVWM